MKKIDFHCHVTAFPQYIVPHTDGSRHLSAEEQITKHNALGVTCGILQTKLAPECLHAKLGSENCKHLTVQYPDHFRWFCGVDPRMGGFRDNANFTWLLNQFKSMGAVGVGEVAASLYIDDPMMQNLIFHCMKNGMPVLLRYTKYCGAGSGTYDDLGLRRTKTVLRKYPGALFIVCGAGIWDEFACTGEESPADGDQGALFALMRSCENLHCDLSGPEFLAAAEAYPHLCIRFLREFSDRLYYGSAAQSAKDTSGEKLDALLSSLAEKNILPQEDYENIVYKNAAALLDIPV